MYLDKDVESVWNEFDSCIKKVAKEVFGESKDVGNWLRKLIWLWNKKVQTIVKWERERERVLMLILVLIEDINMS